MDGNQVVNLTAQLMTQDHPTQQAHDYNVFQPYAWIYLHPVLELKRGSDGTTEKLMCRNDRIL